MIQIWMIVFSTEWFNLVQPCIEWFTLPPGTFDLNHKRNFQLTIFDGQSFQPWPKGPGRHRLVCWWRDLQKPSLTQRYSRLSNTERDWLEKSTKNEDFPVSHVTVIFRGLVMGYCTTIVYYRSQFFHLDNGNRRVAKKRWEVEFWLQWTLRL